MEQIGLALILFAAFWVGCAAGYIAMRLRAQVAYEKGRNEAAAEISALTERLNGRDTQFTEARQRADTGAETIARMDTELRAEIDRRTLAEARLTLLPRYEAELEVRGKKLAEQQVELTKFHVSTSELSTRLEEMKRTSEDKINAIQALQTRVTESFQTMSAEALMSNNKAFLDLAGDALTRLQDSARGDLDQRQSLFGQIMEPLKSSLDRVDSRIGELERDRATAYAGLQQQVESMMRTQVSLQAETAHLASALRTPSSRGRWGEVQLRRVVELAGMISHCDFIEPRGTDETGAAGRPDLIVQLPNFRQIVVDSKVSLAAYLESNDAADETARVEKRREHAAQVRAHVTQLSAKGYWDQFPQSPEFVIAFLPGESFFSAALEHDPALLEFGVERRVILATPTTLIALLRAVAWGWKQEMVSSNAKEIRDLGKALYDRLRSLADNFTEVQRGLSRTTAAFNRTVGNFESSVIPSARRLRELGASTGDEIVSPPPVDSSPRSLQLLAEATEPAAKPEPERFDAATTRLATIGAPASAAPVTAGAVKPLAMNHGAFEPQRPALTAKIASGVPALMSQELPRQSQSKKVVPVAAPVSPAPALTAVKSTAPALNSVPAPANTDSDSVPKQPTPALSSTPAPVVAGAAPALTDADADTVPKQSTPALSSSPARVVAGAAPALTDADADTVPKQSTPALSSSPAPVVDGAAPALTDTDADTVPKQSTPALRSTPARVIAAAPLALTNSDSDTVPKQSTPALSSSPAPVVAGATPALTNADADTVPKQSTPALSSTPARVVAGATPARTNTDADTVPKQSTPALSSTPARVIATAPLTLTNTDADTVPKSPTPALSSSPAPVVAGAAPALTDADADTVPKSPTPTLSSSPAPVVAGAAPALTDADSDTVPKQSTPALSSTPNSEPNPTAPMLNSVPAPVVARVTPILTPAEPAKAATRSAPALNSVPAPIAATAPSAPAPPAAPVATQPKPTAGSAPAILNQTASQPGGDAAVVLRFFDPVKANSDIKPSTVPPPPVVASQHLQIAETPVTAAF